MDRGRFVYMFTRVGCARSRHAPRYLQYLILKNNYIHRRIMTLAVGKVDTFHALVAG